MGEKKSKADIILIVLALFLFIQMLFIENSKVLIKGKWYEEKIQASNLMMDSINIIKDYRIKNNIPIDNADINMTGLIGAEWSDITTTLGSLDSKRTSTNPNMAAVVVDMLKSLGVDKGDKVCINLSSSFPSINIAVLSAVEVLELEPVSIFSIGASTWGGNIPEFTYGDMEYLLYQEKLISNISRGFSLGGADDVGREMDDIVKSSIIERLEKHGREFIYIEDYELNIDRRLDIYDRNSRDCKAFINAGGNIVSLEKGGYNIKPGVNKGTLHMDSNDNGLIYTYLNRNIPVIQLLNIKKIATQYGLPIDPKPLPKVGEGQVYYRYKYSKLYIVLVLLIVILTLILYRKKARAR